MRRTLHAAVPQTWWPCARNPRRNLVVQTRLRVSASLVRYWSAAKSSEAHTSVSKDVASANLDACNSMLLGKGWLVPISKQSYMFTYLVLLLLINRDCIKCVALSAQRVLKHAYVVFGCQLRTSHILQQLLWAQCVWFMSITTHAPACIFITVYH